MEGSGHDAGIDFVTLGMFIIDDIYPPPTSTQKPQLNIAGGAGTYSAIGARLFSPPPASHSIGWIVDAGTDFPPELRTTIESWQTSALIRPRDAPTTKGWNGYSGNEHRAFKYRTEKKRLTADDLTTELLGSRSFHLICSPGRCIDQVNGILHRRKAELGDHVVRPIFVWEPVPDLCVPEELENTFEALKYVDVVSPNHEELANLFGAKHGEKVEKRSLEEHAKRLMDRGIGHGGSGAVVVRVGAEGCLVQTTTLQQWLPAYHQHSSKVVDPTGGGNGFLGGLSVGLVSTGMNVVEAARWGSVAASFCIEQVGMPNLETTTRSVESEKWNCVTVLDRLDRYRNRTV
ncbi:hypothetical protein DOTSEDRAFT_86468 [Dothistroma septosporum NZE10]|uniref:Carbohydrate kinase PfkB domain-containing protein n=1 Tax=Dothistroma septosporum (strain NZE10 / CBS 128990) TaxID=675120 RepID=N1Q0J0_DOTSN|nr:hypothetical protein DOTSEDRAFT_86468 [Dothistroma septosporum NZE10]